MTNFSSNIKHLTWQYPGCQYNTAHQLSGQCLRQTVESNKFTVVLRRGLTILWEARALNLSRSIEVSLRVVGT